MVLSRLSLGLGLIRGYVVRVRLDLYVSSTFVYFHQSDTKTVIADICSYKPCLWPVPNQFLSHGVSPCLVTHLHAQLRGSYRHLRIKMTPIPTLTNAFKHIVHIASKAPPA